VLSAQHVSLQIKIGWRKVKARLFGQQNGFGPALLQRFREAGKWPSSKSLTPAKEECTNCDMTAAPCF